MKTVRGRILAIIGVGACAYVVICWSLSRMDKQSWPPPKWSPPSPVTRAKPPAPEAADHYSAPHSASRRAADFTDEEMAVFSRNFREKFKPAIEKWCKVYERRVPFSPEDVTLDTFHSRLGDKLYTFMVKSNTLTIGYPTWSNGDTAQVFYLWSPPAVAVNQIPKPGFVPDLKVPVTHEEVISMVKADTGVEFKPNEVLISPTAKACALNGGAFVDVLPAGKDPNNGLNYKVSFVFGSNGNLLSYTRDPFF